MEATDDVVAESKSGGCSRNENGESGGHFVTESEEIPRLERARDLEREVPTRKTVSKVGLVFAETALQMVSRV